MSLKLDASVTLRLFGLVASEKGTAESIDESLWTSEISDEDLIVQTSAGSREALALLFRRYAPVVRMISHKILRNKAEVEDFLQDIFLSIRFDAGKFDASRGSARSWILGTTYRRALSRRRYLNSRHFYDRVDLDDVVDQIGASDGDLLLQGSLSGGFGKGSLNNVFGQLSENQRQTLCMFFIEGYTFDEIAAKLGHTRGNVKNHYFRGLEKLRKVLFGSKLPGERAV